MQLEHLRYGMLPLWNGKFQQPGTPSCFFYFTLNMEVLNLNLMSYAGEEVQAIESSKSNINKKQLGLCS